MKKTKTVKPKMVQPKKAVKTDFEDMFTNLADSSKQWFENLLSLQTQSTKNAVAENTHANNGLVDMYHLFFANTKTFLESQQKFYQEQINLWQSFFSPESERIAREVTQVADKRFVDSEWDSNPFFAYLKHSYMNMSEYLTEFINKADINDATRMRMKFFLKQYLDAIAPTNFAFTNPEVIKAVIDTGGLSLVDGMKHMLHDMGNGYITTSDESQFAVGVNLAITKGKVIFRNELIELLEYAPSDTQTYAKPLLIVPPCINKYYILDLQQDNSMVKYLVDQGFHVFLLSWKSADKSLRSYRWEEYANVGVIKALEVVRAISNQEKVNVLGYCIGGIILTTACLLLQSRKLDWINSLALMTVMLDHTEPGDIKYFLDRELVTLQETKKKDGGIMSGRVIAQTFSALRANELIWNYWISNYLLGKTPQPFDILFWNSDAVDLPVLMHAFLLEHLYIGNDLVKDNLIIDGVKMHLANLNYPTYLFAAQKDHIVPWISAYQTTKYIKGKVRFVLGASGHTAGVVNPANANKRNYWINEHLSSDASEWFKHAQEMPGSWWKDFTAWLIPLSDKKIKAKNTLGNQRYKPLSDAPGTYVREKAMSIMEAEIL